MYKQTGKQCGHDHLLHGTNLPQILYERQHRKDYDGMGATAARPVRFSQLHLGKGSSMTNALYLCIEKITSICASINCTQPTENWVACKPMYSLHLLEITKMAPRPSLCCSAQAPMRQEFAVFCATLPLCLSSYRSRETHKSRQYAFAQTLPLAHPLSSSKESINLSVL